MNLFELTHARKRAGGGYKNRNKTMEGGCYQLERASSLVYERKEVNAIQRLPMMCYVNNIAYKDNDN